MGSTFGVQGFQNCEPQNIESQDVEGRIERSDSTLRNSIFKILRFSGLLLDKS
jgi:hypothetical protein